MCITSFPLQVSVADLNPKDPHHFARSGFDTFSTDPDQDQDMSLAHLQILNFKGNLSVQRKKSCKIFYLLQIRNRIRIKIKVGSGKKKFGSAKRLNGTVYSSAAD